MKTPHDYRPPADPGALRVSAERLAERRYVPRDIFVERDQPVHRFEGSLVITDEVGDTWRIETAGPGGGLRVVSWPERGHPALAVRPSCSNVVVLEVTR